MPEEPNEIHDPFGHAIVLMFSFFILLFVFARWGPSINFATTTQPVGEPFVVSGEGKVSVAPDIAKVELGIQESGGSLKQVQDSVNQKSKTLTDSLKKLGIADSDIQTTSYSVDPQYDYTSQTPMITGYQVSINYEVTIKNFDILNSVFTTATAAGANVAGGINFDLSDTLKNQTMQTAREKAVTDAKTKAEGLAKAAGITLGKIINVSENQGNTPGPVPLMAAGGGVAEKSVAPPSVQPGTTEVDVTISLSYQIR